MAIIIFGKTASGKSRIVNELVKRGYKKIVTTTTRPARKGEVDGIDYKFITDDLKSLLIQDILQSGRNIIQ